jgi:hypothetical protein
MKISRTVECRPDTEIFMPKKDYERLGAIKYSTLSSYGPKVELNTLVDEFKAYFSNQANENRNQIVKAFLTRELDSVYPLIQKTEMFIQSPF